jgi:hypothetical protein
MEKGGGKDKKGKGRYDGNEEKGRGELCFQTGTPYAPLFFNICFGERSRDKKKEEEDQQEVDIEYDDNQFVLPYGEEFFEKRQMRLQIDEKTEGTPCEESNEKFFFIFHSQPFIISYPLKETKFNCLWAVSPFL